MQLSAIICEYNPFHNGHAYQLEKAVKSSDGVVCLMSGDFVQRAEPAVCDKYVRAECALRAGASMVVELPVATSIGVGERFALGAIDVLSHLPQINKLVMGCETPSPSVLEKLAEIQFHETESFKADLKSQLDAGASFAQSYTFATVNAAESMGIDPVMSGEVLSKPNNLLCIAYIKAIKRRNLAVKPVLIPRKGSGYNDVTLGAFASATAIRAHVDNPDAIRAAMPQAAAEMFLRCVAEHPVDKKLYEGLIVDALRRSTPETLAALPDVGEGLESKLYKNACQYADLNKILEETKSKRYTLARLKRICLHALLGKSSPTKHRVLGIKDDFKPYLAQLGQEFYVKTSELSDGDNLLERRADALYTLLTHTDGNRFYNKPLLTVH